MPANGRWDLIRCLKVINQDMDKIILKWVLKEGDVRA
jgi:hypothetical protein